MHELVNLYYKNYNYIFGLLNMNLNDVPNVNI